MTSLTLSKQLRSMIHVFVRLIPVHVNLTDPAWVIHIVLQIHSLVFLTIPAPARINRAHAMEILVIMVAHLTLVFVRQMLNESKN
jgi:hypothetical protein